MATSSGLASVDWLADNWLKYQSIKHQADLPTINDDKNVPDRVDLDYGIAAQTRGGLGGGSAPVFMGLSSWQALGLAGIAVLGVGWFMTRGRSRRRR